MQMKGNTTMREKDQRRRDKKVEKKQGGMQERGREKDEEGRC